MVRRSVFLVWLVAILGILAPSIASAATTANLETRVKAFERVAPTLIGRSAARTPEKHRENPDAYDEIASGSPLAAEAAPGAYSVAFETELAPAEFGMARAQHFQIANRGLEAARAETPALAELVPSPQGWGRPPANWVWQHATVEQGAGRAGVLQLVPKVQHTAGSAFWRLFHPLPGGAGGYSEWAIPAGAPKN